MSGSLSAVPARLGKDVLGTNAYRRGLGAIQPLILGVAAGSATVVSRGRTPALPLEIRAESKPGRAVSGLLCTALAALCLWRTFTRIQYSLSSPVWSRGLVAQIQIQEQRGAIHCLNNETLLWFVRPLNYIKMQLTKIFPLVLPAMVGSPFS